MEHGSYSQRARRVEGMLSLNLTMPPHTRRRCGPKSGWSVKIIRDHSWPNLRQTALPVGECMSTQFESVAVYSMENKFTHITTSSARIEVST